MVDETEIGILVEKLAVALQSRKWRLVVAESCTGGWISKVCTDLAGSSAWFDRGFISYSYPAKVEMLEVDGETLERQGAVSDSIARQMAIGARKHSGVEAAIAVTGIAGPGGATAEKPVGTVWFAWSLEDQHTSCETRVFSGDREAVRLQTVFYALEGLLRRIESRSDQIMGSE